MSRKPREFIATSPDGTVYEKALGMTAFAKRFGLNPAAIGKCLSGELKSHKDWQFRDPGTSPPEIEKPSEPEQDNADDWLQKKREELRETIFRIERNVNHYAHHPDEQPAKFDPQKAMAAVKMAAEAAGIQWKHLADTRSEAEKTQDAVDRLLKAPGDIFALSDTEIDAIERGMAQAVELAEIYIDTENGKIRKKQEQGTGPPKVRAETAKAWLHRLRRIRKMRKSATVPNPDNAIHPTQKLARLATQVLRYMLYVGRSDITDKSSGITIFDISHHHAKMVVDLYMAEHGWKFNANEVLEPGKVYKFLHTTEPFMGAPYVGAMLMYPPRHTKTTLIMFWVALGINQNTRLQTGYVHAKDDKATTFQKHLNQLYRTNNDYGRRNLSLFPVELANYDNNAGALRLHNDDPPKEPNLISRGVWSQEQGSNFDRLIFDDVVSRDDAESETERNRKKRHISSVWLSRFQGSGGFVLFSGYPYHHGDVMWVYHNQAIRAVKTDAREGIAIRLSKMAVGGPQTSPKFKSIWKMYPPEILRRRYKTINDSVIWAANWMLNPISDEMRMVRKIRLYDVASDSHQIFLRKALMHLSLDPAFTNVEGKSDKAGFVLCGVGDVRHEEKEQHNRILATTRSVVRVVGFREIYANQAEASDELAAVARARRVDMIHYEEAGGSGGIGDMLKRFHGIQSPIPHIPGPVSKANRLRRVAYMLEDGAAGLDAVVEFPGRVGDSGELEIDQDFKKLHDYIVNFKVESGFHGLDALTHFLRWVAPQVSVGEGDVTREVRMADRFLGNPIKRHMQSMMRHRRHEGSDQKWRDAMIFAEGGQN